MRAPGEVLVVRTGAIGDVVNALSFAKALKRLPDPPRIGWVVHELAAPLVRANPLVDRVHLWPRHGGLGGLAAVLAEVRREPYGLAVDLQRILKSAAFARLAGAGRVLGWDRARSKEGAWLLAHERIAPAQAGGLHMVHAYGAFAARLGAEAVGPEGVLAPDEEALKRWQHERISWIGPGVVLNLGASKPANRWRPERFGEVARGLEAAGYQVLLTGGPHDREALAELEAGPAALDLVGRTSLGELAALFSEVNLFIGCDTGPMHMAVAMGCPTLALFGPANPARTGPFGAGEAGSVHRVLQHVPVAGPEAWKRAATDDIPASEVLETALAMTATPQRP